MTKHLIKGKPSRNKIYVLRDLGYDKIEIATRLGLDVQDVEMVI